jgi:hypothetical protein
MARMVCWFGFTWPGYCAAIGRAIKSAKPAAAVDRINIRLAQWSRTVKRLLTFNDTPCPPCK